MRSMLIAGLVAIAAAACQQGTGTQAGGGQTAQGSGQTQTAYSDEQKKEFATLVSTAIDDGKSVAQKMEAAIQKGTVKDFTAQRLDEFKKQVAQVEQHQQRLQSATTNYDQVRSDAESDLQKMKDNEFAAAAHFQDARAKQEQRVSAALADLRKKIDGLQAQSAKAAPQSRDDINKAVSDLEKQHTSAAEKLVQLKKTSGNDWAKLRTEIADNLDKTSESYWNAHKKAGQEAS